MHYILNSMLYFIGSLSSSSATHMVQTPDMFVEPD